MQKMRLEMAEFPVTEVRLADRFGYHSGMLEVDESAIDAVE